MTENMTNAVTVPEAIRSEVATLEAWAETVQVRNAGEQDQVLETVRGIKAQRRALDEVFDPSIKQAHELHRELIGKKRMFTDRLDAAERAGKKAIEAFQVQERRRAEEERRRLQAEADERARKERERLEREAARLKTPELKGARLEEAAAVEAPVVQVEAPAALKGAALRTTWKARVVDVDQVPREYMEVNMKALDALARATKGSIRIAGVEFFEDSSISVGR